MPVNNNCCTSSICCTKTAPVSDVLQIDSTSLAAVLAFTPPGGSPAHSFEAQFWDGTFTYNGCLSSAPTLTGNSWAVNGEKPRNTANNMLVGFITPVGSNFILELFLSVNIAPVWSGSSPTVLGVYTRTSGTGTLTKATMTVTDAGASISPNNTYSTSSGGYVLASGLSTSYTLSGLALNYVNVTVCPATSCPFINAALPVVYADPGPNTKISEWENTSCFGNPIQIVPISCGAWQLIIFSCWQGVKVGGLTPAGTYYNGGPGYTSAAQGLPLTAVIT